MTTQRSPRISAVVAMAAIIGLPAAGGAQVSIALASADGAARADALHVRAEALYEHPDRYAEAALLMRQAARLRPAGDVVAVDELVQSGRLYAYAGDRAAACASMEEAAERALEGGDVMTAAHALIDAAFLAIAQQKWHDVEELSSRAEVLAGSPLLSGRQRTAVLKRIDPAKLALANAGR